MTKLDFYTKFEEFLRWPSSFVRQFHTSSFTFHRTVPLSNTTLSRASKFQFEWVHISKPLIKVTEQALIRYRMICTRISKQSNHNRLSVISSHRFIQKKFKYWLLWWKRRRWRGKAYIQLSRQTDNSWLMFDSSSSLFLTLPLFLASRKLQDDFPSDGDEESDEDSFDDETR